MPIASQLHDDIAAALSRIVIDAGGGCSVQKASIMAWLIQNFHLARTLDIGVYRGRSLVPQAIAHARHTGGVAYGVDPFTQMDARQHDNPELADKLETWLAQTDFDEIRASLQCLLADLALEQHCRLVRMTSAAAARYFQQEQVSFDLIHVDGNHDTAKVMADLELYLPLLAPDGFLVLDDISFASVRPAYELLANRLNLVLEKPVENGDDYAIFCNGPCGRLAWDQDPRAAPEPVKLSVFILAYNHERFIAEALRGVLGQRTRFSFEVVVGEDASTDGTADVIRQFQADHPGRIRAHLRRRNVGMVRNFIETYRSCRGQYVAFLDGDDYWTCPDKLQKQVDFLDQHPDHVLCCHNVLVVNESAETAPFVLGEPYGRATLSIEDLLMANMVSSASIVARNGLIEQFPAWLSNMAGCDWVFGMLLARQGKIGYLRDTMAVYRKHALGSWSPRQGKEQWTEVIKILEKLPTILDASLLPLIDLATSRARLSLHACLLEEEVGVWKARCLGNDRRLLWRLLWRLRSIHQRTRRFLNRMGLGTLVRSS